MSTTFVFCLWDSDMFLIKSMWVLVIKKISAKVKFEFIDFKIVKM